MGISPKCPVCASEKSAPFTCYNDISLFSCGGCGTVHMFPLPTSATTKALYDDAYEGGTTGYYAKVDQKMCRSRGRMRWLRKFVGHGRFLDVGSNGGFMVEAARECGFEAWGLDIDPVSVRYARAHYPYNEFVLESVERFDGGGEQFDLIYCSEVIEHVPGANEFVGAIARLLRTGGFFFVTTPDIGHWHRPKNLNDWDGFCPPSHCIYYTPSSLRFLLERHGFEIIRKRFAWKPGIKMLARRREPERFAGEKEYS